LALLAAGTALALTGCAAGQYAQTSMVSPSIDGTSGQVGGIAVRNAKIAYPDGGQYEQGADARVLFTVVNLSDQDDALTDVRSDAATGVTFAAAGSATSGSATASSTTSTSATATTSATTATRTATPLPTPRGSASASASASGSATASATASAETPSPIAIPVGQIVSFQDNGPAVMLTGLKQTLLPTEPVQVTFVFRRAGELTLTLAVAVPLSEVSQPPTIDINPTEGG